MKRFLLASILVGLCLVAMVPGRVSADIASEKAAVDAAHAWLKLVDAGDYAASYKQASSFFKSSLGEADWVGMLGKSRKPLGKLLSRTVLGSKSMTSLPGVPDGKYVVIQFNTTFEKKAKAVETVTSMLDKDGKWRVGGYFIR